MRRVPGIPDEDTAPWSEERVAADRKAYVNCPFCGRRLRGANWDAGWCVDPDDCEGRRKALERARWWIADMHAGRKPRKARRRLEPEECERRRRVTCSKSAHLRYYLPDGMATRDAPPALRELILARSQLVREAKSRRTRHG